MLSWGQGPFRWRAADAGQAWWPTATDHVAHLLTERFRDVRHRATRAARWLLLGQGRWVLVALMGIGGLTAIELQTSWLQSRLLGAIGRRISYVVGPGPSPSIRYPASGPHNLRMGYVDQPGYVRRLLHNGFGVTHQARWSPLSLSVVDAGLFPIYEQKVQAGLRVVDRDGRPLYVARHPHTVYASFDEIAPLVVETLLFVENRELLEDSWERRNPAIEYPRLLRAVLDLGRRAIDPDYPVSGGSTLATQLEKLRHSPDGRTRTMTDKGRQIASASLRAYLGGERTARARRAIVRDYVNALPLGAVAGYGEVTGLSDGLGAWYGADAGDVNRRLMEKTAADDPDGIKRALAYRQTLSLLLAARRPTTYLRRDPGALDARVDAYLHALAAAGIIPPTLRDRALEARIEPASRMERRPIDFAGRKAIDSVRTALVGRLGTTGTYELDRLDLTVRTTLDGPVNDAVTRVLGRLGDAAAAREAGLVGGRLLHGDQPDRVIYSFALYERGAGGNQLRVQADTYDHPLSINDGTRLELGSTAKLRTLVTYLEIVERLHGEYSSWTAEALRAVEAHPRDRLRVWALEHLRLAGDDRSLDTMIEAALSRRYSASPAESFFTGGGVHRFQNFDGTHNGRWMTVREAFRDSVNLVFVRLMRDLVRHYVYANPEWTGVLHDVQHPARGEYLTRFADREGRQYLRRFFDRHRGVPTPEALARLASRGRLHDDRLTVIFRTVSPKADVRRLDQFLRTHDITSLSAGDVDELYALYDPTRWTWQDLGYLAGVHPLELWLVGFLHQHPDATLDEVVRASATVRQEAYAWLFKTRNRRAQQRAIDTLVEEQAFERLHTSWRRHGYAFTSLVPSYATALGSSGDNPASLSELVGLILGDGVRHPAVRVTGFSFAEGTPYQTHLQRQRSDGERVLSSEVAAALRRELVGVVEHGTGRRLAGGVSLADGRTLPIGGKTGTGDNRFETRGPEGQRSRVVNRTATFVFTIGDRFFGTVVAYVPGSAAAGYDFTSALPVQLLKHLLPMLQPVLDPNGPGWTPPDDPVILPV